MRGQEDAKSEMVAVLRHRRGWSLDRKTKDKSFNTGASLYANARYESPRLETNVVFKF